MSPHQRRNAPPTTTIVQEPAQTEADVISFWTAERMRSAEPLPLPELEWSERHHEPEAARSSGRTLEIPPNLQGVEFGLENLLGTGAAAASAALAATPVDPGGWPYSAIGKLFMTFGGKNYVGTGFSVSGSRSVLMTAGHCVYDQPSNQWASNVMIALSYSPSSSGVQFSAVKLITLNGWVNNQGHQYDIGAAVVSGDMFTGRGNLGLMFNQPVDTSPWSAVGYPAGAPYPGNQMYQAVGSYIGAGDPNTSGMSNNDMTGGSSGGPWLVNSNWGYVNGNQSYRYTSAPNNAYTPYWGQGAYNVWICATAGQC